MASERSNAIRCACLPCFVGNGPARVLGVDVAFVETGRNPGGIDTIHIPSTFRYGSTRDWILAFAGNHRWQEAAGGKDKGADCIETIETNHGELS
jgi:hypothetical protein